MMGGAVHRWAELTREELRELTGTSLTVLPIASIEQHGPHLPTVTDTALVETVLDRACLLVEQSTVLRAPTLCYGASDHHLPFGGTLSLTSETLAAVLRDLLRSLGACGCRTVLVLNGHGGNEAACRSAAADAAREHALTIGTASYWDLIEPPPTTAAFLGHAGAAETSMMLAVAEPLVRLDLARPSSSAPAQAPRGVRIDEPDLWQRLDGFTDDPREATKPWGDELLDRCARALAEVMEVLARLGPPA
jgi:creatinine amidohydrolase